MIFKETDIRVRGQTRRKGRPQTETGLGQNIDGAGRAKRDRGGQRYRDGKVRSYVGRS